MARLVYVIRIYATVCYNESAYRVSGMIIFIGGMPRSGSTFAFNVVRDVLWARGRVHQEATSDVLGAVNRGEGASHVIVKAHSLDASALAAARRGVFRTIITVRRIEDACASWLEIFPDLPVSTCWDVMHGWLDLYQQIGSSGLRVSYNTIDRRHWIAAWRIGRYVARDVTPLEIARIVWRYRKAAVKQRTDTLASAGANIANAGWTHYDKVTFFHRRHVSPVSSAPAEHRLSADILQRVRSEFAAEIRANPNLF